jgi:hypothetical protein
MLSFGFMSVFLTAPYAVSAEHDKVAAASVSISSVNLTRYLWLGTKTYSAYSP